MRLLFLLPLLLLLIPVVNADSFIADSCEDVNAFDYAGQTECTLHSDVLAKNKVMFDENEKLMDELKTVTKEKLDINNEKKNRMYKIILALSSAIFVLITTYTGYLYISSATYPEKREMAKMQLKNLVFIAIAIIAIGPFVIYINDISQTATNFFYGRYFDEGSFVVQEFDLGTEGSSYEKSLERYSYLSSVSPMFQAGARSYILSMQGRNMLLLTLMSIFPLIIILFFFEPAQEFGRFLVYLFLIEEFVPIVFVIVLVLCQTIIPTGGSEIQQLATMRIMTAALFFSVIMHAVLVLLAVLKSTFEMVRGRRYIESSSGGI